MELAFILFWVLVVWRLTALIATDTITGPIRDRIGVYYGEYSECRGRNIIARALCCHRCSSVWVALGVALVFIQPAAADFFPVVLMLSAGSIIVNRIVERE
jgi:hypothetical protein